MFGAIVTSYAVPFEGGDLNGGDIAIALGSIGQTAVADGGGYDYTPKLDHYHHEEHHHHQPSGHWEKKLKWKEDWVKEWKIVKKEAWETKWKAVSVPVWKEFEVPVSHIFCFFFQVFVFTAGYNTTHMREAQTLKCYYLFSGVEGGANTAMENYKNARVVIC